jgi:hypothetical protein
MQIHTFPFQSWESTSKWDKTSYLIMLNFIKLIITFSYQSTLYMLCSSLSVMPTHKFCQYYIDSYSLGCATFISFFYIEKLKIF